MQGTEWRQAFEEYVQKVMKENQIPGVIVGLAKDGQLLYGKGFGSLVPLLLLILLPSGIKFLIWLWEVLVCKFYLMISHQGV